MKQRYKVFFYVLFALSLIYGSVFLGAGYCFAQTCGGQVQRCGLFRYRQCTSRYYVQRTCRLNRCFTYSCNAWHRQYKACQCYSYGVDKTPHSCYSNSSCKVNQTFEQVESEPDSQTCSAPTCNSVQDNQKSCNIRTPVADTIRTVADLPRRAVEMTSEVVWLAKLNAVRSQYGRHELQLDHLLFQGAKSHCRNMAYYNKIYHAQGCGYEIVAQNYGVGVEEALDQWLNSSGHRAILLSPSLTYAGVAAYRDNNGLNWCAARFR